MVIRNDGEDDNESMKVILIMVNASYNYIVMHADMTLYLKYYVNFNYSESI